ncbi:MAG: FAD-binding oxidoreductase [Halioglobus sp.]|nr:FAD-binding oxidoreductase [Halioglobus sp.]
MVAPPCPSYYEASRNDATVYPALGGEQRADVCIVGGGFTGIAAALTLAERGYSVAVLEQNRVGWGASGRNGGQCIGGMTGEDALAAHWGPDYEDTIFELGYRGHDVIKQRVEQYGIECDLKHGYMDVALRPRHLQEQREWYEDWCRRGLGEYLELVPQEGMPAVIGSDAYLGALVNRRNMHLHPLNLCLGEAQAATSLGVSIYEGSEVTGIRHGARPVVSTRSGSISADAVIVAGNAYHALEQRKLGGLLFPAGTFIIATEPLSAEEAAALLPQDFAVCDQNTVLDYYRLSADRRMLFGGRCNYTGREPRSIEAVMRPRMLKIFPQLAHKRIDYAWGGQIGIVLNRVPLMGRIEDNVYYAMGYSGHGVNMTHAFGEILADAVAGNLEKLDLFEQMPHTRLPFSRRISGQLVGLGMLFHRLRDML